MELTEAVPDRGLGLVLKRAEVPTGEELEGAAKLKEALSLRRKRQKVPGLQPGLKTDELAMAEGMSWEPHVGVSSKMSGPWTESPGGWGRSFWG